MALFGFRIATPSTLVFDEVHYVPAARTMLALERAVNTEHPLLGKAIIAAGIALFGDNALGWRFFSALAGSVVVVGVFAAIWLMLGRMRPAVVAALLTMLNFTVFVQARIAMLDGFMAAFVVAALACFAWSARGSGAQVWRRWLAGSILLGLATACKWAAAPYVAFAGIGYLALKWQRPARWPGLSPLVALSILGIASILAYALTFAPAFFYVRDPLTLAALVPFQARMYAEQTQILPAHTYQSSWWTWPLDLRPIWYLYEPVDGAQRGILLLGNPAIMWGGLVAVAACVAGWLRTRAAAFALAAGLWIAGFAVWAAIPKSLGFYYYYYLPSIWLSTALAVAFDWGRDRFRYWDEAFVLLAAVLFVHFYPILAATPLSGPGAFRKWMWLKGWP
nr:phospholipid carrier-dependent glycosyltransferase [Sphingomonas jinjuensis]